MSELPTNERSLTSKYPSSTSVVSPQNKLPWTPTKTPELIPLYIYIYMCVISYPHLTDWRYFKSSHPRCWPRILQRSGHLLIARLHRLLVRVLPQPVQSGRWLHAHRPRLESSRSVEWRIAPSVNHIQLHLTHRLQQRRVMSFEYLKSNWNQLH